MPVTSYSRTPASNNSAPPNGWPEGMAPSSVNDCARQLMTDIVNEATTNACKVLASVAGTNTITGTLSPDLTAYTAGMIIVFTPAVTNTGAVTLNIDSLGALDILKNDGDALSAGDLVAGVPALLMLDSGADDWILLNPQILAGSTTVDFGSIAAGAEAGTNITVTGAAAGDCVAVGCSSTIAGLQAYARVAATDTVRVGFFNYSSGAIDPASATFNVRVIR